MNKAHIEGFDTIKGIACIAVVLIHYNFIKEWDSIGKSIMAMCRFAVPVFFLISGYFYSKDGYTHPDVFKKIRHVLGITLLSTLFYFMFCFWWNVEMSSTFDFAAYLYKVFDDVNVLKFFITNRPFVYGHFWFLWALIYCYAFVGCMENGRIWRWIVFVSPLMLILTACSQEFATIFKFHTVLTFPGGRVRIDLAHVFICRALPFFLIGVLIKRVREEIISVRLPNIVIAAMIILGVIISLCEYNLIGKVSQFYVGSYLAAIAMMIFAVKNPDAKGGLLAWVGKELSMYVFVMHVAVGKTYDLLAKVCHLYGNSTYYLTRSMVVLFATFAVAIMLYFGKMYLLKVVDRMRRCCARCASLA